jgi:predicted metal-dependent enzyme (double-stranded beta helix superfamily)
MTNQIEKQLSRLVGQSFKEKSERNTEMVKDFCLDHFSTQLETLKQKMKHSHSLYYEKEILLVNNDIEVIVSGWLPGNTCYPHDHDQAACFVFVLTGQLENTLFDFDGAFLEVTGKTSKAAGDVLYLAAGIIHHMENTGNDILMCLHVYQPGISEMKVFDEQHRKVYTLSGEAGAWLPPNEDHYILDVTAYTEKKVEQLMGRTG